VGTGGRHVKCLNSRRAAGGRSPVQCTARADEPTATYALVVGDYVSVPVGERHHLMELTMNNVLNFPAPAPVQPSAPDWAQLDQLLEQASDWLASGAGAELYHGPNQATMEVLDLCRHMLAPKPPCPGTSEPEGLAYTFAEAVNEAAVWLLNYYGDELDSEDHNRIVCLSWGTTEPVKRFGGWSSCGALTR